MFLSNLTFQDYLIILVLIIVVVIVIIYIIKNGGKKCENCNNYNCERRKKEDE